MKKYIKTVDDISLQSIANSVCREIPEDTIIYLVMEDGYAGFEVLQHGLNIELPDSADKSLIEQLNDAIDVSRM